MKNPAHALQFTDPGDGRRWVCACGQRFALARGARRPEQIRAQFAAHLREVERGRLLHALHVVGGYLYSLIGEFAREPTDANRERVEATMREYQEAEGRLREAEDK